MTCAELLEELVPELPWRASPWPARVGDDAEVPDIGVYVTRWPNGTLEVWVTSQCERIRVAPGEQATLWIKLAQQLYTHRGVPSVNALIGRMIKTVYHKEAP